MKLVDRFPSGTKPAVGRYQAQVLAALEHGKQRTGAFLI